MVQQGDFVVQLVEANTKTPFKEHLHDGKTFVEVEPGEEYFIAIQKPTSTRFSGTLVEKYYVDGQDLRCYTSYNAREKLDKFHYRGCWEKEANDLTSTITALRFVTPSIRAPASSAAADKVVGKVEVKLFQGINPRSVSVVSFEPVKITPEVSGTVDKSQKSVRSTNGKCKEASGVGTTRYDCGPLLSTIALQYCTTPGLIGMGVIPGFAPKNQKHKIKVKQENERKRRAVSTPATSEATSDARSDDESVASAKAPGKAIWTVDLTDFDSD
eukprot:scaffold2204_cov166-Amphora_coffeaeformis.AAC.12